MRCKSSFSPDWWVTFNEISVSERLFVLAVIVLTCIEVGIEIIKQKLIGE